MTAAIIPVEFAARHSLPEATMHTVQALPIAASFPMLQTLQRQRAAEVAAATAEETGRPAPADAGLLHLCAQLREDQNGLRCFGTVEPQRWESFSRDTAALLALIRRVAETPASSRAGLRAKALALHALLDEGGGGLYDDAAAPDLLAWSLVQDILAE
jgi:hypothetical protein